MIMPIFLAVMTLLISAYLWWGFTYLPAERWQILAAVPVEKSNSGLWRGVNLTWYGFLTANAYAVAVIMLFVLMGAVGISPVGIGILAVSLLACCVPASRLVARIVEKKAHTFTVGGAVFVGIVAAPWIIFLVNRTAGDVLAFDIPPLAALAALAIAYSFGEGLGRLACISFGCCYGKPLSDSPLWLHRFFTGSCFVFSGKTKKIAYADGMDETKVLPVQALTAILYCLCGLGATILFLAEHHAAAFILATAVTQVWRTLSEMLRADYRGQGAFSKYQVMGMLAVVYAVGTALFISEDRLLITDLSAGLATLWDPVMLLFLQLLWLLIFLYTGRSTVTGATLSFHVHSERV